MEERDNKSNQDESETDLANPLGLGGSPVTPDAPEHLRASNDEDEVRRRRKRALDDDHEPRRGMADVNRDHKGATGIDMGAGGHNTQISDKGTKP